MEKTNEKTQGRGKLIHIRLSPRTHQKLKIQVAFQGTTLQAWVSHAIRKGLRTQKSKAFKPGVLKAVEKIPPVQPQLTKAISPKGGETPRNPSEGKPK